MKTAGVIAAAGLSSRMGAFKPLLPYEGRTVIESTADLLRQSGAERIFIVVGHNARDIEALFEKTKDVVCIYNPDYKTGDMFSSVRLGLQAAVDYDYLLFLPGDMPAAEEGVCCDLLQQIRKAKALWGRPIKDGRGQHPVILSHEATALVASYEGEGGLRGALRSLPMPPMEVAVEDPGCTIDIDTPDEYRFLLRYTAEKKLRQKTAAINCVHFV